MKRLILVSAVLSLAACGGKEATPDTSDAGASCNLPSAQDAGAADAGNVDAGNVDAGPPYLPQVPANLGQVMNPMKLVTLVASNDADANTITGFSNALPSSSWWSASGQDYGLSTISSMVLTGPAITADMSESDLRTYIGQAIADGGAPQPDGNTLYLVYVPLGHQLSDTNVCGYHNSYPNQATSIGDGMGVVQHCSPAGGDQAFDELTEVASHEIIEAATDPTIRSYNLGITSAQPWQASVWNAYAENGYVEVGDLCEGSRTREGGYAYQRVYSNSAAREAGDPCVPARSTPYFNVKGEQEWYAGQAGTTVTIPFTGYATGTINDWIINPHWINVLGAFTELTSSDVTVTSDKGNVSFGLCNLSKPAMNDGVHGTMQVAIPADARSGDYIVFNLHSYHFNQTGCAIPSNEDAYHSWVVGVYVP